MIRLAHYPLPEEIRRRDYQRDAGGEETSVTVCVAAMCDGHTIIGASDRMVTAGDVEFEPQQSKIVVLTTSIAVMVAGDSTMQAEILQNVRDVVNKRIEAEPSNWWNVRDVAELYGRYYNEARVRRAESSILAPLGLDNNSFIGKQQEMDPSLVRQLATELINFEPPGISSIIAGVDISGAHIYVANNHDVRCRDLIGFAAIGVGSWHANSQVMFAGHTRDKPLPETLLLVYSAKKRAEVAPGVGEATDMFVVGPRLGTYNFVGNHVLNKLEEVFRSGLRRERRAAAKSRIRVTQYVEEIIRAAIAKEQTTVASNSGGDASSDEKELRNGSQESQPEAK